MYVPKTSNIFSLGVLYPAKKYQPNWQSEANFLRCYNEFVDIIGLKSPGNTIKFTPEDYKTRYVFYGIDLSGCPGIFLKLKSAN